MQIKKVFYECNKINYFWFIVCAKDEDGGENCREQILPVSLIEQLEDEGLLPGFNLLLAISALGVVGILRRRTH